MELSSLALANHCFTIHLHSLHLLFNRLFGSCVFCFGVGIKNHNKNSIELKKMEKIE